MAEYALSESEVTALERNELTALFEATARAGGNPRAAFNWVSGEVARKINELGERFDRQRVTAERARRASSRWSKRAPSAPRLPSRSSTKCMTADEPRTTSSRPMVLRRSATRERCWRACGRSSPRNAAAVAQIRSGKTGTFGFLVGPGHEGDRGQSEPQARQRATPPRAGEVE